MDDDHRDDPLGRLHKGTIPPNRAQTRLPTWYEGRADVVGEQSELAALLTAIAVLFVQQHE